MKTTNLKKLLSLALALLLVVAILAACGSKGESSSEEQGSGSEDALSEESLTTIGDIYALEETEDMQNAVYDGKAIFAFKYKDNYYRTVSSISKEDEEAYIGIDFADEDYEEQQKKILEPLAIDTVENLTSQILSQDDLDALVGKTGKDLVADGWKYNGSYNLDNMEIWMENGPFVYTVVFDGTAEGADTDNYDPEQETKDLKVKSIEFNSIGDATNLEDPAE